MLSGRLTGFVAAVALATAACSGVDGTENGAIRENVIEPGITAIDQSRVLACGSDAATLRTAADSYELLDGAPAPDESTLVDEGFLREESQAWDIVDGELVAQDPSCAAAPDTVPATEIVTDDEPMAAAEVLATFTPDEVDAMGGSECAGQLAVLFAGAARYVDETGAEPTSLTEVDAGGFFEEPITLWQVVDGELRPAEDSPCNEFVTADPEEQAAICGAGARTLAVAREAYLAVDPGADEPTQRDLVDDAFLTEPVDGFDLVDGEVVAMPGGDCDGVDIP